MIRGRPSVTLVVLVGFLVAGGVWWIFFRGPSDAECAPVRELLTYNKTQVDALNAKTVIPEEGSYQQATEPSDVDYHGWVDGLTDRAAKVTSEELAGPAKDVAATAGRLVRARLDVKAMNVAPGAPPPPAALAVSAFNEQLQAQVSQLAKTCPA